jgi:hypothetical protein
MWLIRLEIQELCVESSEVLLLELSLFEALMPSTLQSPVSVVSRGELAHSSEALLRKELCGLLASLKADSPGYGKNIACALADIIRKMEKSLGKVTMWRKKSKRNVARKALATT